MSSERDFEEFSSMFERMIQGGDGLPRFLPVIFILDGEDVPEDHEFNDVTTRSTGFLVDPLNLRLVMISLASGLDDFLNDAASGKLGKRPASKSSVESMPRDVIGGDKEKIGACAICLEEWSEGDVAAEMPCKHKFHSKCVEEWLGIQSTCPLCRYEMPIEEEEKVKGLETFSELFGNGGNRRSEEDGGR